MDTLIHIISANTLKHKYSTLSISRHYLVTTSLSTMNPVQQTQAKINPTGSNIEDKGEAKDTKPVNYEWPPTPEPNPTYLCVIA